MNMKTVQEVSNLTGVSVRTLHYYDQIGLLKPTQVTESGYRMYDVEALEKLQHIMLFRELQFPLKDIKEIIQSSDFDRNRALEQQIELLTLKKEHIENLITFARGIHGIGVKNMDFSAFDATKIDEYAEQVKTMWGKTPQYKEYAQKTAAMSAEDKNNLGEGLMEVIAEFGKLRNLPATDEVVQAQVQKLQAYITDHFYTCSNEILHQLGKMYVGGGSMTENIDAAGGKGCAEFIHEAIKIYCEGK